MFPLIRNGAIARGLAPPQRRWLRRCPGSLSGGLHRFREGHGLAKIERMADQDRTLVESVTGNLIGTIRW
jgi:hypothetical protein